MSYVSLIIGQSQECPVECTQVGCRAAAVHFLAVRGHQANGSVSQAAASPPGSAGPGSSLWVRGLGRERDPLSSRRDRGPSGHYINHIAVPQGLPKCSPVWATLNGCCDPPACGLCDSVGDITPRSEWTDSSGSVVTWSRG